MHMESREPRARAIGFDQKPAMIPVFEADAEFRGLTRRAHGDDMAGADLRIDANADRRARRAGLGQIIVDARQFLEIVDIEQGAGRQSLGDFAARLGRAVENDPLGRKTRRQRAAKFAGTGDFAGEIASGKMREDRRHRIRLRRESMHRSGRESRFQSADRRIQRIEIDEAGDRRFGIEAVLRQSQGDDGGLARRKTVIHGEPRAARRAWLHARRRRHRE